MGFEDYGNVETVTSSSSDGDEGMENGSEVQKKPTYKASSTDSPNNSPPKPTKVKKTSKSTKQKQSVTNGQSTGDEFNHDSAVKSTKGKKSTKVAKTTSKKARKSTNSESSGSTDIDDSPKSFKGKDVAKRKSSSAKANKSTSKKSSKGRKSVTFHASVDGASAMAPKRTESSPRTAKEATDKSEKQAPTNVARNGSWWRARGRYGCIARSRQGCNATGYRSAHTFQTQGPDQHYRCTIS
jgi:hypothetical protein